MISWGLARLMRYEPCAETPPTASRRSASRKAAISAGRRVFAFHWFEFRVKIWSTSQPASPARTTARSPPPPPRARARPRARPPLGGGVAPRPPPRSLEKPPHPPFPGEERKGREAP